MGLAAGAGAAAGELLTKKGLEMAISQYMGGSGAVAGGTEATDHLGLGRALAARYDERSQILYELNKPVVHTVTGRRTKNSHWTSSFTLSKMEIILLLLFGWSLVHDFPLASKLMNLLGLSDDGTANTETPVVYTNGNGEDTPPAVQLSGPDWAPQVNPVAALAYQMPQGYDLATRSMVVPGAKPLVTDDDIALALALKEALSNDTSGKTATMVKKVLR